MKFLKYSVASIIGMIICTHSLADEIINDDFCAENSNIQAPLRNTQIIIDSALISPESAGEAASSKNQFWRQRVINLMDASKDSNRSKWASREPVSISVAEADGSGLKLVFSGCMPFYSQAERKKLSSATSSFSKFIGTDWERKHQKVISSFRSGAITAMKMAALDQSQPKKNSSFTKAGLGQAMARGFIAPEDASSRIIILTDLTKYSFDTTSVISARAAGKEQADNWGADLGFSEVHVLGAGGSTENSAKEYLKALFLGAKGNIITMAGINGALPLKKTPISLRIYRGLINFPTRTRKSGVELPITLRLTLDKNSKAINSWVIVQRQQEESVPLTGTLTCLDTCRFIDSGDFAQIWSDSPGGEPEYDGVPFGGMRDISFSITDKTLEGSITDPTARIAGKGSKQGLDFKMELISQKGAS
jgi:hypothetical protein